MAKFIYKLQNILEIKNKMERQAKSVYAEANLKLNQEQEKLEQMIIEKKRLEDHYRELATGTLAPLELMESRRAIDFQRERIKGQLVEIRVAQKNLDLARARLSEAVKERKTHEKLRENAFEEFLAELSAEEKKEIDEVVSYRFGAEKEDIKEN